MLFGLIAKPAPQQWKGTKLHINRGIIGGKQHYLLPSHFGPYFKSRAGKIRDLQRKLSPRQLEIIEASYASKPERAAASETFQAFDADVRLFGDSAFEGG